MTSPTRTQAIEALDNMWVRSVDEADRSLVRAFINSEAPGLEWMPLEGVTEGLWWNGMRIGRVYREKPAPADPEGGYWWSVLSGSETGPRIGIEAAKRLTEQRAQDWLRPSKEMVQPGISQPSAPLTDAMKAMLFPELHGPFATHEGQKIAEIIVKSPTPKGS